MKLPLPLALICAASLIAGCASQPERAIPVSADSAEIVLPRGQVEHARLLAMGMARSKGWQVAEADQHRLVLERTLPANAPQIRLLSASASPEAMARPKLQVETRLSAHRNGVLVGLRAFVIRNPGTELEQRIDYTQDYQEALLISLNALASAWLANRQRIASAIPIPPQADPDDTAENQATALSGTAPTPDAEGLAEDNPSPDSARREPTNGASAPMTVPPLATSTAYMRSTPADATGGDDNPMLALGERPRRGIWAFYAEASARARGCEVSERGAVLLSTTPPFELHEVQCDNGANRLLQCQGGICREAAR